MTDLVFLHLLAGNGGHGRVAFRREKYVPKGGPDGGDGGSGGNIVIRGNKSINTLREFAGKTFYKAPNGGAGAKKKMTGAKGENIVLEVPLGTTIWQITENMAAHRRRLLVGGVEKSLGRDKIRNEKYELFKEGEFIPDRPEDDLLEPERIEEVKQQKKFDPEDLQLTKLVDIIEDGQEVIIVQGGVGGKGNTHFKSSAMTTPLIAEYGTFGEQRMVSFELKLLADVGLVGLPNAGKSTLVSRLTSARPKVAAYPFTTLEPHLGIYQSPKTGRELVIADIPGLIEGASEGKGLGFQFLRHILNCKVLLYVLSLDEAVIHDPALNEQQLAQQLWQQYQLLHKELKDFNPELDTKRSHTLLNKIDLYSEGLLKEVREVFKKNNVEMLPISAATGLGIEDLDVLLAQYA